MSYKIIQFGQLNMPDRSSFSSQKARFTSFQNHLLDYFWKGRFGRVCTVFLCSLPSSVHSFNYHSSYLPLDSLVAQMVKSLPTMQETWVQSLDQENPLEKGMATHCSILAWKIPWMEEPGGLQSIGSQRVGHDWATSLSFSFHLPLDPSKVPWYHTWLSHWTLLRCFCDG